MMTHAELRARIEEIIRTSLSTSSWLTPSDEDIWKSFSTHAYTHSVGGKMTRSYLINIAANMGTCTQQTIVHAGAAFELFQASALVHDDIIDNSPLRRGHDSAHISFAREHEKNQWLASSHHFGLSSAITLGDYLLPLSFEHMLNATEHLSSQQQKKILHVFSSMMCEVAYGQFLDIRAENIPHQDYETAHHNAINVLLHKSARYSVEMPLYLGALLGGLSDETCHHIQRIGHHLGIAFQLRDDALGVFGDPQTTGKPACSDIQEGKKTLLVALVRKNLAHTDQKQLDWFDQHYGITLDQKDLKTMLHIIDNSGACSEHEKIITMHEDTAQDLIDALPIERKDELSAIAQQLSQRNK
ncbi:MAG: polyprenyl synthetase family protein [Actinomycetaceae bacterium]|nr:polyprenyl synthetase family protein [Actinomycetaceae bacterium]